jgi:hypothetical protein
MNMLLKDKIKATKEAAHVPTGQFAHARVY